MCEAIAVMLFYQIGELFQSYAVGKSRRNISRADGYPPGLREHRGATASLKRSIRTRWRSAA